MGGDICRRATRILPMNSVLGKRQSDQSRAGGAEGAAATKRGSIGGVHRRALASLIPPPRLRLSEWIEANVRLPEGTSALPGPVRLFVALSAADSGRREPTRKSTKQFQTPPAPLRLGTQRLPHWPARSADPHGQT